MLINGCHLKQTSPSLPPESPMCASVCVLAALLAFLGAPRRARVSTCGKHRSCMWKMLVNWNVKNGDELNIQAFKRRPNTKPNILLHDRLVHTGGKYKTNATSVIMHPHSRTHNGEKSEQGPKLNLICGFAAGTLQQRTDQPAAVYQPESELLNETRNKLKNFDTFHCKWRMVNNNV